MAAGICSTPMLRGGADHHRDHFFIDRRNEQASPFQCRTDTLEEIHRLRPTSNQNGVQSITYSIDLVLFFNGCRATHVQSLSPAPLNYTQARYPRKQSETGGGGKRQTCPYRPFRCLQSLSLPSKKHARNRSDLDIVSAFVGTSAFANAPQPYLVHTVDSFLPWTRASRSNGKKTTLRHSYQTKAGRRLLSLKKNEDLFYTVEVKAGRRIDAQATTYFIDCWAVKTTA